MKRKVLMIDPPSGWKYGFPKELTVDGTQTVTEWLVDNGYPQALIDQFGGNLPCRHWEEEVDLEPPVKTEDLEPAKPYDDLGLGIAYSEGYDFT
jgi:hypothetical protein